MRDNLRRYVPALLCALVLPLCAVAVHPHLDIGINDDWTYTRSALVFARTGRLVYSEWQSAMVGWQAVFAALLVRLFGASCDVVRSSTLLVAMATALLVQRSLVRTGIGQWNAVVGTLALVLSPLSLSLTFGFMTDVYGLFTVALSLYACLRALRAEADFSRVGWIAVAALGGAVGGTSRQVAWLGAMVMVPSTIWLLRRHPRVVLPGLALYFAALTIIAAALVWFKHQPHTLNEGMFVGSINLSALRHLGLNLLRMSLELAVLLFPVLFLFVPALWRGQRRTLALLTGAAVAGLLTGLRTLHHGRQLPWLAPYLDNYVTEHGLIDGTPILGGRPVILHDGVRLLITIAAATALAAFVVCLFRSRPKDAPKPASPALSWAELAILLGPFTLSYLGLLLPRASFSLVFDRYLLAPMLIAILLLLRYAQDRLPPGLPLVCLAPVLLFGAYGVAGTHDAFAMFRARLAAVAEVEAAGVPANEIDAGLEFNGITQSELSGFPDNLPYRAPGPCETQNEYLFRDLHARYALSFDPGVCGGRAAFSPVVYKQWLGPSSIPIYIVSVDPSAKAAHP